MCCLDSRNNLDKTLTVTCIKTETLFAVNVHWPLHILCIQAVCYLTEGQGSTFVGDGRHVTMNHLVCGGRGGGRGRRGVGYGREVWTYMHSQFHSK